MSSNPPNTQQQQQQQQQQPPSQQQQQQQQQQQPLSFQEVPVQTLEQLRPRLTQLTHSLRKFEESMIQNPSLPNWSNLQNQFNVILSQLTSFSKTLDDNQSVLRSTNVYPNTEFDTTQFEGLLTTMLRKKHLPEVEEWINKTTDKEIGERELNADNEISAECTTLAEELLQEFVFGGYLTKDEIDSGKTFDELLIDEVKEEEVKTVGKAVDGNDIYRFIYQGLESGVNI